MKYLITLAAILVLSSGCRSYHKFAMAKLDSVRRYEAQARLVFKADSLK